MKYLLFALLLLTPTTALGVTCPIPNCPVGQLCFCPPPPPHYLVTSMKKSGEALCKILLQHIRGNLLLTSHFKAATRFRPRSASQSTPLDQISPWSEVELSLRSVGSAKALRVVLYARATPRSTRRAKTWETTLTFTPSPTNTLGVADSISNQIMTQILKRPFGAFGTAIAFVHKMGRGTSVIRLGRVTSGMQQGGARLPIVSFSRSLNKEPLFTPKGTHLLFTSHIRYNPDLYITKIGSNTIHRISARKGVNHAVSVSPDSRTIAATLSYKGNPDIFLLRADYSSTRKWRILRQLTRHHAIDTSPAHSPDGKAIAFVSSRRGRAQIYLHPLTPKGARPRLLFSTKYRTYTPKWCKSGTRNYLAFTQLVGNTSVIFIYNMNTKRGWRATKTSSPNAENPTWSPHCNLIAYEVNGTRPSQKGIAISPLVGGGAALLLKGSFAMPTWGR